ncbi:MAG: glycyl-radical enzyme activating protein [Desulfobacula sp.]|nr:glycyl-radical enzyme activating protein [Desulfobacula sp.]
MMQNAHIFKIQRYSIHDGPGIRTTLFFQGCPLRCPWCHNPESQKMPGKIRAEEMDGLVSGLISEIEKDRIFYDDSGGGATFSGGEPLSRPDLLFRLLDQCREGEIHTCVDTSGCADAKFLSGLAEKADLILYDIKLMDAKAHETLIGKPVFPVLDNLRRLSDQKANVWMRFPFIPGMTDTKANIKAVMCFLEKDTVFRKIHILPFHKAGEGKYEALKFKNPMKEIKPPSPERVAEVKAEFESRGFQVIIGG